MASNKSRKSSGLTDHELSHVLWPFVKRADFIDYPASLTAKLDVPKIKKSKAMWKDLQTVQTNCSFKQKQVEKALTLIHKADNKSWPKPVKDDKVDVWARECAKRIRSQGRAIGQALIKKPQPRWLRWLLFDEDDGEADGGTEEDGGVASVIISDKEDADDGELDAGDVDEGLPPDKKPSSLKAAFERGALPRDPDMFYGFSHEHKQAWRAPASHPEDKEFTATIRIPSGASKEDHVEAVFSDEIVTLHDLTVEEHEIIQETLWATKRGALWTGAMKTTGAELNIYKSADRTPLLLFKEKDATTGKKGHILQLRIDKFGSGPQAVCDALEVMTQIAELYSKGDVQKSELPQMRDDMLKTRVAPHEPSSTEKQQQPRRVGQKRTRDAGTSSDYPKQAASSAKSGAHLNQLPPATQGMPTYVVHDADQPPMCEAPSTPKRVRTLADDLPPVCVWDTMLP